jgi:hypothetical protein
MGQAGKMVRVTVARGRSVQFGNNIRNVFHVGEGGKREAEQEYVEGNFVAREGERIDLPEPEAKRLHELGFVRHEGEAETRPPSSTFVDVEGGVNMAAAAD